MPCIILCRALSACIEANPTPAMAGIAVSMDSITEL